MGGVLGGCDLPPPPPLGSMSNSRPHLKRDFNFLISNSALEFKGGAGKCTLGVGKSHARNPTQDPSPNRPAKQAEPHTKAQIIRAPCPQLSPTSTKDTKIQESINVLEKLHGFFPMRKRSNPFHSINFTQWANPAPYRAACAVASSEMVRITNMSPWASTA